MNKASIMQELSKNFEKEYYRSFETHTSATAKKRLLGSVFFNTFDFVTKYRPNIEPFVLIALEQRMKEIKDDLEQEAFGHFFGNLYFVERSRYFGNKQKLQTMLQWSINDVHTAHILMLAGSNLCSSLGSTFFERLGELVKADCILIDERNAEFCKLAAINLCNVNHALYYYAKMPNADAENAALAKRYMASSLASIRKLFVDETKPIQDLNLLFFIYLTMKRCMEILMTNMTPLEEAAYKKIEFEFESKVKDQIVKDLFPKYFAEGQSPKSTPKIKELVALNDAALRNKLATILQGSGFISSFEKERLIEDSKKPHTGNEISDMDVRIEIGQYDKIHVCFPIKSGAEIKKTVPEDIAYQIMKPFIKLYDACVVVFITARPCSQALDTYIKQLKAMYALPIAVIQDEFLARILEFYGEL